MGGNLPTPTIQFRVLFGKLRLIANFMIIAQCFYQEICHFVCVCKFTTNKMSRKQEYFNFLKPRKLLILLS